MSGYYVNPCVIENYLWWQKAESEADLSEQEQCVLQMIEKAVSDPQFPKLERGVFTR